MTVRTEVRADASQYNRELDRAGRRVDRFSRRNQIAGRVVGQSFRAMAVGVGVGVAAFAAGSIIVNRTINALDRVEKAARNAGISIENLQSFEILGDLGGASLEATRIGLQRFNRRIGEAARGTGTLRDVLVDLDIPIRDIEGNLRSTEDVLRDFAQRLSLIEDPAVRASLAMSAFDTEGVSFGLALAETGNRLPDLERRFRSLGLIIDEEVVRGATAAKDELTLLGTVISKNLQAAVGQFLPTVTVLTSALINLASAGGQGIQASVGNFLEAQGGPEQFAVAIAEAVGNVVVDLRTSFDQLINSIQQFGVIFLRIIASITQAIDDIPGVDLTVEVDPAIQAELETVRAQIRDLTFTPEGTGQDRVDRQNSLNALLEREAELHAQAEAATTTVSDIVGMQADALETSVRSQEELNALSEGYRASAEAVVAEVQKTADGLKNQTETTMRLTDAQIAQRESILAALGDKREELELTRQLLETERERRQVLDNARNAAVDLQGIIDQTDPSGAAERLRTAQIGELETAAELIQTAERLTDIYGTQALEMGILGEEQLAYLAALRDQNITVAELEAAVAALNDTAMEGPFDGFADNLSSNLANAITSGDFSSIGDSLIAAIQASAAQDLTEKLTDIFSDIFSGILSGTGGGSGLVGAIAGLFGGARRFGGDIASNRFYLVGEDGPELFAPGVSGSIIPNSNTYGGDTKITNNYEVNNEFNVNGGGGNVEETMYRLLPEYSQAILEATQEAAA